MANVVNSLFGLSSNDIMAQQRASDEEMAQAMMRANDRQSLQRYAGAKLGATLGRAGAGLFGLEDPQLVRAREFETVLQEAQQELGQGMNDPTKLYPSLVEKLNQRGFSREASQVAMQGQEAINNWNLQQAKISNEDAQTLKYRAETAKAMREGKTPKMEIFAKLAEKSTPESVAKAIDNNFDISLLSADEKQIGESQRAVSLRKKITEGIATPAEIKEYQMQLSADESKSTKVTNVMPGGSKTEDVTRIRTDWDKYVGPIEEKLGDMGKAFNLANMARTNPTAGAQLDYQIANLISNKKLSNEDMKYIRSGNASFVQKLGDRLTTFLDGRPSDLTLNDKVEVLKAFEKGLASKYNTEVSRTRNIWKTSPMGTDTIDALTAGREKYLPKEPTYTVGKSYTDAKGNKAVYQADGTWKETK